MGLESGEDTTVHLHEFLKVNCKNKVTMHIQSAKLHRSSHAASHQYVAQENPMYDDIVDAYPVRSYDTCSNIYTTPVYRSSQHKIFDLYSYWNTWNIPLLENSIISRRMIISSKV